MPQTHMEAKRAETEAFAALVKAALDEAHKAAAAAFAEFARAAEKTPDGRINDLCGGAAVIVRKPSYRFGWH